MAPAALAMSGAFVAWTLVAIVVLLALVALLAAAGGARPDHASASRGQAAEGRPHAMCSPTWSGGPSRPSPRCLPAHRCLLVHATLGSAVADDILGPVGVGVAIALDVAVVFVLAETARKTLAVLDPERVALRWRFPCGRWPPSPRCGGPPGR